MRRLIFITLLLTNLAAFSQDCFSVRYFGLTIHPFGDNTAALQPYKLDKTAHFVANFGGFVSVDHYVWHDILAITGMQGVFTDCSGGPAGFTHIGIRGLILERKKHRIMLDVGPLMYYRRDWNRFETYEDGGYFHRYHSKSFGDVQCKFFPVGFEISWNYVISKNCDLNVGILPWGPAEFSVGISWWPKRFEAEEHPVKLVVPKRKR